MNKLQIERYAKKIGTYEISIRPGVASCGVPTSNPSTSAKRDRLNEIETALDTQGMVSRAVENARIITRLRSYPEISWTKLIISAAASLAIVSDLAFLTNMRPSPLM